MLEAHKATRTAKKVIEKAEKEAHLEHLKEQHQPQDPLCDDCDAAFMTRTPAKSMDREVRGTEHGYVLGVDFMGPYVKSVNGKVWCMVAVEARHGYTIVKTLPDKESRTVKVAMQEIIREFQIAIGKGKKFVVRVHSDK